MNYADYAFYTFVYHGTLAERVFVRHIVKASAFIRRITFGRSDACVKDDTVKLSACAVCDVYAAYEERRKKHQGRDILSENTDGYTVSFVQEQSLGETAEELLERKAYKAAEMFLDSDLLGWEVNE